MSDKKMDFGEGGSIPADQHDHHNAETPSQKRQRTEAAGSTTRGGESKLTERQEQLTRTVKKLRGGFVEYANKMDDVSLRMHGWSKKQHWGCLEHLGMQPYVIKTSECPLEKVVCDPVHSGSDFGRQKFVANFAFPGMGKTMGMFLQTRQCLESHPSAHAVFVTFNGDHQPLDRASESCREFPDQVAGFGWRLLHSALFNGALNSDNPDSASRFASQTIEFRKSLMDLKGLTLQDYIATTRFLLGMEPQHVLVVVLDEIGKFIHGNDDSVSEFVLQLNEQLVQKSAKLFVSLVYQKQFAELFRQSQGQIEFHNVGPLPMSRVLPDFFCTNDSAGNPTGKALFSDKLIALSKLAARGYHGRTVRAWMAASQDEGAKFNPATHLAADYWQIEKVMCQDFLEDRGQSSINQAVWEAFDLESDDTDRVLTSVQKGRWSLQYCREKCKYVAMVPPVLLVHETLPKHYPAHFPGKEPTMGLDEVTYRLGLALMSVPSHNLKLDGEIWGPESFEFIRRQKLEEYRSHLGEGKLFEETMMYWLLGQILNSSGKSRIVSNLFLLDHISPGMADCGSIKVPCSDVAVYRPYLYGKDGNASRETVPEVQSRIRELVEEKKICCVVPDGKYNRPQDFSIIFDGDSKLYCFHFQCKEKVDPVVETGTNPKGFRQLVADFERLKPKLSLGGDITQEDHFIFCSVNHNHENLPDNVNCSVISLVVSKKQTGKTSTGSDHSLGRCMLHCPTLQYSMSYLLKGEFHPSPATGPNHAVAKPGDAEVNTHEI